MSVSAAAATRYFDEALEKADYYAKSDVLGRGLWGGRGAERLGLSGEVSRDDFLNLASNKRPSSEDSLTERTKEQRRAGYDFTFSVPKSISLYLAENGDRAVEGMVQEAFRETMQDVEAGMEARVRGKDEDGMHRNEDRTTGNLVYAWFTHTVTRPIDGIPDPHYHIHAFAFNATYDQVEQRWKAGQFGNIKRDAPFYEAAFHARLAEKLLKNGYGIRRSERDFELASVSRELIDKFSRRTREIERLAREKYTVIEAKARARAKETGMDFADAFAEVKSELGAQSRERKSEEILGPEERLRNWREQMTVEERASLSGFAVKNGAAENLLEPESAKDLAIEHLFERTSIARELHAAGMLLQRGIGKVRVEEAREFATGDTRFVQGGNGYVTTRDALAEENQLLRAAAAGRDQYEPLGGSREWQIRDARVSQTEEQTLAVEHVLRSRDLVLSIRGAAGTGKTTMMREAVGAIETLSGKKVFVFAPSSSAVDVLKREGFVRAETFQQLAASAEMQQAMAKQVLWVDEAGFLSVKQMNWLVHFAGANGCRLILGGDTRQHHGVERGDGLRIMERAGVIVQAALTKIFRQQIAQLREAIAELAAGRTEQGFTKLDEYGAVLEEGDKEKRLATITEKHLEAIAGGNTALIVSPTHGDARVVAEAVRQGMRCRGLIGTEERVFTRLQNLNWTESERSDAVDYVPGQVVEFHRITPGVRRNGLKDPKFLSGEQWRVKRKDGERVVLERNGAEKELPLSAARNFSVYQVERLALSVGDRVRVTKNFVVHDLDGKLRCRNNELHAVAALDENGVKLSNGVRLASGQWHIDQGIVVTSHAAQGKTVDQVIASVPITAFGQTNEAQFYVTMSRARRAMYLFTDSKTALKEAVMRTSERVSAYELLSGGRWLDRASGFSGEFERTRNHGQAPTVAPTEELTRDTLRERISGGINRDGL